MIKTKRSKMDKVYQVKTKKCGTLYYDSLEHAETSAKAMHTEPIEGEFVPAKAKAASKLKKKAKDEA